MKGQLINALGKRIGQLRGCPVMAEWSQEHHRKPKKILVDMIQTTWGPKTLGEFLLQRVKGMRTN